MGLQPLEFRRDAQLQREVGEVRRREETYRTVAILKNRYRIRELLSVGGFGVIFTAEDTRLFNKRVLVKANRYPSHLFQAPRNNAVAKNVEKFRDRLAFERKMLLQAGARGIDGTPVLLEEARDFGLDLYGPHTARDGTVHHCAQKGADGVELWTEEPFLVLSFVSGVPLSEAIPQEGFRRNLLGNAKQVILQIGRILGGFHAEKVLNGSKLSFVYQDLKPDNIMFTREKSLVLIDFGGFAVRADGRTLTRFVKTGTPGYQPPEFSDYGFPPEEVDARADIFSLGATVFHVLSGTAPKSDPEGRALLDVSGLGNAPKPWKEWLLRATAAAPKDRFPTMSSAIGAAHNLPLKPAG
jgi:serine/threonine protein kinase